MRGVVQAKHTRTKEKRQRVLRNATRNTGAKLAPRRRPFFLDHFLAHFPQAQEEF